MAACGICSRPMRVEKVTTELGVTDLGMCAYCDHIKCPRCGFPDSTGVARRCISCGQQLMVPVL